MEKIMSESRLLSYIKNLDLWLVSPGGSGSTEFRKWLEKNGYVIQNDAWKLLGCHHKSPLKDLKIPCIYLYGDLQKAYMSVSRRKNTKRGPFYKNQEKLNNILSYYCEYSEENLWNSMANQMTNWLSIKDYSLKSKVLLLYQEDLYTPKGQILLEEFLGKKFSKFLVKSERKSIISDFDENILNSINNFVSTIKIESKIIPSIKDINFQHLLLRISKMENTIIHSNNKIKELEKELKLLKITKPSTEEKEKLLHNTDEENQLLIRNLPLDTSENDIHSLFDKFGKIVKCIIKPQGFGYISFLLIEDAIRAQIEFDGIVFKGNNINVSYNKCNGPCCV